MRSTVLINNFYSTVFSCSTCFERFTLSSSGVLPNILYYTLQSVQSCYQASLAAIQLDSPDSMIVPIVPKCVKQYILPCCWWWTSNSFETRRARKNVGIKIIYKNCASRWSSTHYLIHELYFRIYFFTSSISETIQAIYLYSSTEEGSRNSFCRAKTTAATRHECVCL